MEILLDFSYEVLPAVVRRVASAKSLDFWSDVINNCHSILLCIELGHLS